MVDAKARTAQANALLQRLPDELAINGRIRAQLAPLLVAQAEAEGWQLDSLLLAELSKDQGPVKNPSGAVRHRIEHLRPNRSAPAKTPLVNPCDQHPGREAATCGPCAVARREEAPAIPLGGPVPGEQGQGGETAPASAGRALVRAALEEARRKKEAAAGRAAGLAKKRAADKEKSNADAVELLSQRLGAWPITFGKLPD
ncbi:hypothetical protein DBP12_03340 [Streptomyces sp. CS014]|nr:hypothetical protein DBP12_03340 [Streptomyces sp. CS014]